MTIIMSKPFLEIKNEKIFFDSKYNTILYQLLISSLHFDSMQLYSDI